MTNLLRLFFCFLGIGLTSIGGGYATIPNIQQQVVVSHGWLTMREFTDIITISQMTPGPLAVNTSTFVGVRLAGPAGAVVATLGCILCGFLLSLGLYRLIKKSASPAMGRVLEGLRASSTGLIASAAASLTLLALLGTSALGGPLHPDGFAALLFAGSLLALRRWKMHPIALLALAGAAGLLTG